jgi:hypothetical protein
MSNGELLRKWGTKCDIIFSFFLDKWKYISKKVRKISVLNYEHCGNTINFIDGSDKTTAGGNKFLK